MTKYYKFPSTRHIMLPQDETARYDKILSMSEIEELLSKEITVEEKIDGANLGISYDGDGTMLLQNRGDFLYKPFTGQWKSLENWMKIHDDLLFDILLDRYILFGEWCYAMHSIYYNALPDWFIGFDIYDKEHGDFLSVDRRNLMMEKMNIQPINRISTGKFTLPDLMKLAPKSVYGDNLCEGIYIRQDEGKWLKKRAKLVRRDFRQEIEEHWSRGELIRNRLCTNAY